METEPILTEAKQGRPLLERLKGKEKIAAGFATVLIGLLALLWGYGWLMRPEIIVRCGAIDLQMPIAYQMEIAMMRTLMNREELVLRMFESFNSKLKEFGMEPRKADQITFYMRDNGADMSDLHHYIDIAPNEEQMISAALASSMAITNSNTMMQSFELPRAVLFFQIENKGRTSANNAHVVVRLTGRSYRVNIDTDNKILSRDEENNILRFDLHRIAPGSRTKGIVWYTGTMMISQDPESTPLNPVNEVLVSYDEGTVRARFFENSFYLSE